MGKRLTILILVVAAIALATVASAIYVSNLGKGSSLPPGCAKPADGFLIIASHNGYNDSIAHGAPDKPWPIIRVQKGATVTIAVCNTDRQAHGFQVTHYFDGSIETVAPGQVVEISFVASQAGTFEIYCSIFCTIHVYMQNGQLIVT
jgi:hypothetical protein